MTLTKYSGQYEELFTGCAAYYDGSYSGTTLYNIINPTQNATMGAHASIVADRNGLVKAIQTTPSSTTDSTAAVSAYPNSGTCYAICFWVYVVSGDGSGTAQRTICFNTSTQVSFVGEAITGSFSGETYTLSNRNSYYYTYTTTQMVSGWHHIILFWNGSSYLIYIDGIVCDMKYYTANVSIFTFGTHTIGAVKSASLLYHPTVISDYMVFTSQPTIEQMLAIYKLQRNKYLYPVQAGVRNV